MNHQLPPQLLSKLETIDGFNKKAFEEVHYNNKQITSIRFNTVKYKRFAGSTITHPTYYLNNAVPWCASAFYLDERPKFTFDPLLHAGAYYVQEASSMFLWEALKQNFAADANIKVLDLCAAPGGKTTLLNSYFKNALIVSNEIIKSRANILYENVTKWGADNIVITNNDAADFKRLPNYFDLIVVDAPCSGSGLFRKDNEAIDEWSLNNVELCSQRQQKILADVHSSLKPDGILIYSTCSYSQQEDEDILDWLVDSFQFNTIQLQLKDECLPAGQAGNIVETTSLKQQAFSYRFWPDKVKGEGFFIAVLKKNDEAVHASKQNNARLALINPKETNHLHHYLIEDDWIFFKQNDIIRAAKKSFADDIATLQKNLYLKKAGILLGEVKGKDLVPNHELALSTNIGDAVLKIELDELQALQYLRKKEILIESNYKGWALCTYQNFPLGWIKILHNRVNNYYLTDWRIRKE